MAFAKSMWLGEPGVETADRHVGFFAVFELSSEGEVEIQLLSPGTSLVWLDGKLILDGPLRYAPEAPEFLSTVERLRPGRHTLAIHACHDGLTTRIMPTEHPLLGCQLLRDGLAVPLDWQAGRLSGYASKVRRINPQLGWIDWVDTSGHPQDWMTQGFGNTGFAVTLGPSIKAKPSKGQPPRLTLHPMRGVAAGNLTNAFGYERDDISARFFLRDLAPKELPPQGVWRRYDLGQVRLGRAVIELDAPAGAVIDIAMSEALNSGRVTPWITLSAGESCNLDHFIGRGGPQIFMPTTAKGGRYIEVHVLADPGKVSFLGERFLERHAFGDPIGSFESGDRLLDRIWLTGVHTLRACAEDSVIDNPTRERGQWTGDVATVSAEIAAVAHGDLALILRGLSQSAACAREDGLVAGLCPGGGAFLSTYAAQWISAAMQYWRHSGDKLGIEVLYPAAQRNVAAFLGALGPDGISDSLGWAFIDWGYVRNEGPTDMGLNLHFLLAVRDMSKWAVGFGHSEDSKRYFEVGIQIQCLIRMWLDASLDRGSWAEVGFHRAVLALRAGMLSAKETRDCIGFVKAHYLNCFPNRVDAPRLSDPDANNPQLITPYFSHYALAELWEHGEGDFVLDQYRKCWGWALREDRTTWVEVFDPRWSHCHAWSGCPTWQLSRYVLGLVPRLDLGPDTYAFDPKPCGLDSVSGKLPLVGGGHLQVSLRKGEKPSFSSTRPVTWVRPDALR